MIGSDRWLGCRHVRVSKEPLSGVGGGNVAHLVR